MFYQLRSYKRDRNSEDESDRIFILLKSTSKGFHYEEEAQSRPLEPKKILVFEAPSLESARLTSISHRQTEWIGLEEMIEVLRSFELQNLINLLVKDI